MSRWTQTGPVVVGVPDTGAEPLIPTAVSRAREHDVAIDLVRVWRSVDWLLSAEPRAAGKLGRDEDHDRALLEAAERLVRESAPDVAVVVDFQPGDLYNQLLDRTRGASLLVIGDDLGQDASIAAWYLDHAFCPVAVIDDRGNITAEGPGSSRLARYGPHGS